MGLEFVLPICIYLVSQSSPESWQTKAFSLVARGNGVSTLRDLLHLGSELGILVVSQTARSSQLTRGIAAKHDKFGFFFPGGLSDAQPRLADQVPR
jgi:hypothetical protein